MVSTPIVRTSNHAELELDPVWLSMPPASSVSFAEPAIDRVREHSIFRTLRGWGRLVTGGLEVREIPGAHFSIMTEPYVQTSAEHLRTGVRVMLSVTFLLTQAFV